MAKWNERFAAPLDLAALAIERSRKGWRPTPAQKAAWAKKRAAAKRKAVREARKRIEEERRAEGKVRPWRPTPGAGAAFLATFQPGCWYGLGDLIAASGLKRGTVHGLTYKFHKQGELERTKNPAFVRAGFQEPEWLYRRVLNPEVKHQVQDQAASGADAEEQ